MSPPVAVAKPGGGVAADAVQKEKPEDDVVAKPGGAAAKPVAAAKPDGVVVADTSKHFTPEEEAESEAQVPFDINDPAWRSSKDGKAAYARAVRSMKAEAPKEVIEEFDRGRKGELFKLWMKHAGDWMEVCYTTGLRIRTNESADSQYRLWSRAEIETKFGSVDLAN